MLLDQDLLFDLADVALGTGRRDALLQGLPRGYLGLMRRDPTPKVQLMHDLAHLNRHREIIDFVGPPLLRWLRNLHRYLETSEDRALINRALVQLGAPPIHPKIKTKAPEISMPAHPADLINELADRYLDTHDARLLWERAGGKKRDVRANPDPVDLWQTLWGRSVQGAQVRPEALLRAALEDLPHNPVLIGHLSTLAPPEAHAAAARLIEAVEQADGELKPVVLEVLESWPVEDDHHSFAAICPALEGREPAKRRKLHDTLQEIKSGALTGLVGAGVSTLVKTVLEALAVAL